MMLLLVLRPEPGNAATCARARAGGHEAVSAPLFMVRPIPFDPPALLPPALLFTSAQAARALGVQAAPLAHLPVYAVGAATAAAAAEAGFAQVHAGIADAAAIVARAADDGVTHLLHLAGREHRAFAHPRVAIDRRIVYAAEESDAAWPIAVDALRRGAVALLHSARAARVFAGRMGEERRAVRIAAISDATRRAAGAGWAGCAVADAPDDAALLAASSRLSPDPWER